MTQSWFYRHNGKTFGPVSTKEIEKLAGQGDLDPQGLLWPESSGPNDAVPVMAALHSADLAVTADAGEGSSVLAVSLPDWLKDVQGMERQGPLAGSGAGTIPDWLEDLRLWVSLERDQVNPRGAGGPVTNATRMEVVTKARAAIEKWVDDEGNRELVVLLAPEEIVQIPKLADILREYAKYGPATQKALLRYLARKVESRRQDYAAQPDGMQ